MSEVKRLRLVDTNGYPALPVDDCIPGERWVSEDDFDRVTAERDAALAELAEQRLFLSHEVLANDHLQQRLTAADDRADVLEVIVGEVLDAVGREPLNLDAVLRLRSRMRAALKPADGQRNQCDGCQAGIPVVNGAHRMGKTGGYPDTMSCTAKLYADDRPA